MTLTQGDIDALDEHPKTGDLLAPREQLEALVTERDRLQAELRAAADRNYTLEVECDGLRTAHDKAQRDADEVNRNAATQLESAAQYIAEQRTAHLVARLDKLTRLLGMAGPALRRCAEKAEFERMHRAEFEIAGEMAAEIRAALAPSGDGGGA